MDEFPLVSIITPVYNHEKYLEEYFEGIIQQTYENIELILIDDASKDNSKIIIESWIHKLKERFVEVIYINRLGNKGLLANCNEGLRLAKGKYIALFASDDVMLPQNIKLKVEHLEKNPENALVHSAAFEGETFNRNRNHITRLQGDSGKIFNKLIKGNLISAPTVMMRREVVLEIGGYNENWSMEDYPMWLEITYRYPIGYINEPLIFYRLSPMSLSRGIDSQLKLVEGQISVIKDWNKRNGVDIKQALENVYVQRAIFIFLNNKSEYIYYRSFVSSPPLKLLIFDLLYKLNIPPEFVGKYGKSAFRIIKRLLKKP